MSGWGNKDKKSANTGTVAITAVVAGGGGGVVTGSSTVFDDELKVGEYVFIVSESLTYIVTSIASILLRSFVRESQAIPRWLQSPARTRTISHRNRSSPVSVVRVRLPQHRRCMASRTEKWGERIKQRPSVSAKGSVRARWVGTNARQRRTATPSRV